MVNIHAREITDNLASLVKQIDALVDGAADLSQTSKHSFVVLLTDDPEPAEARLEALASQCELKNTPLTLFQDSSGPSGYKIDPEAEVTVMMWVNQQVRINHSFRKGELDEAAVQKVVADAKQHLR